MRNPERIRLICFALERFWSKNPDMRFFQMLDYVEALVQSDLKVGDLFYLEDDRTLRFFDER